MPKPDFQTEVDLITSLREGDEAAFAQIFKKYWFPLYEVAFAKVQSHELAEEIVQDLLVTLWVKRNILLITNLSHYLFAALKNRCIDHIRKQVTQEKYFEHCKTYFSTTNQADENEHEVVLALEMGLSTLPEKSRSIFISNKFDGVPNKEIAKKLKISEKSVQYHITKCVKQLRHYLRDYLGSIGFILATFF